VIEVDSVNHRDAVRDEFFIEVPFSSSPFSTLFNSFRNEQLFKEEMFWIIRKEFLSDMNGIEKMQSGVFREIWRNSVLHDSAPPEWFPDQDSL